MGFKVLVLYHYYHPDDVVSAQQFTGLCEGLTERGYEVEVWPSNRSCFGKTTFSSKTETVNKVRVKRLWRPGFDQHRFGGRILNAIWMLKAWWLRLLYTPSYRPDLILIGTDPLFSVLVVPFLKWLCPWARVAHWCFDLYPEAAIADNLVKERSFLVKGLKVLLKWAYEKCDLIVNIGECMGDRLKEYSVEKQVTLTPWALEEPAEPLAIDSQERAELFGDSSLSLLYSGSFGRAHEFQLTLQLARKLGHNAVFNYATRGSRLEELKAATGPDDRNIRFAEFAPQDRLAARLSAADVHLVSLRPDWIGVVVPSKFFGSLAAGRPVLFEGDAQSSIALWIEQHKVGWVLRKDNLDHIAQELTLFGQEPQVKMAMFRHCHTIYQQHFSKKTIIDGWDQAISKFFASNR